MKKLGPIGLVLVAVGALAGGCAPGEPQTGSQTNWVKTCDTSAQCGLLSCICGACTRPCDDDEGCAALEGASCVPAGEDGVIAVCGGVEYPGAGLCMQRCDEDSCGEGAACVAGVCSPIAEDPVLVAIDLALTYQTLVGFGASLGYVEDEMVGHPAKEALFDAMFSESGIDVVRLGNRYEGDNPEDASAAGEILTAAAERLGRAPTTIVTSATPPPRLKANGSKVCSGDWADCTLIRGQDGEFDYAGFAAHWRDSLEAYAAAGVNFDYLSIQNNPNWIPPETQPADACHFLPVEGETNVVIDGVETAVTYPGFAQALDAVRTAVADLPAAPAFAVPEVTGLATLGTYAEALDPSEVAALAHHLYGFEPETIEEDLLSQARELAADFDRPLFQTEMRADGMDTAIFMQKLFAGADAAAYLQNDFVASATSEGGDDNALISLKAETFEIEGPFHSMRHFARWTDPGWVRVSTSVEDAGDVLVTAWMSPDAESVTVVLVNAGTTKSSADLEFATDEVFSSSEVTRTTFDGVERSATLGTLSAEGVVALPGRSIVTVALSR